MQEVYIVAAVRTPIGRFGGGLMGLSPADLGATVMKSALEIANLPPEALDLYIFGNVLGSGHGQLIPRQAAIKAGIPVSVDGYRVDMVCSSGMIAVSNAATSIRAGEADLVLAGGIESMSQTGFFLSDRLCLDRGVSRQALDEIAALSHQRAATATEKGWFKGEIVPIELKSKKGSTILDQDEGIRSDSTPEGLGKLRPAFNPSGVLTAGNSSQISDGAAAILLASQKAVDQYGLKPIAKILGGAVGAGKTDRFPEFPVLAVKKLLASLNKTIEDFDLVENNEAFALNNLLFEMDLGLAREKQNVHGGAIALGHPIGASGARILVTLINALKVQDKTLGMGAICHGTGGGTAIAIERV